MRLGILCVALRDVPVKLFFLPLCLKGLSGVKRCQALHATHKEKDEAICERHAIDKIKATESGTAKEKEVIHGAKTSSTDGATTSTHLKM